MNPPKHILLYGSAEKPVFQLPEDAAAMQKYFRAKDAMEGWEILCDYRYPQFHGYRKWYKRLFWFFVGKRLPEERELWEQKIRECEEELERKAETYRAKRQKIHARMQEVVERLVPELWTFTGDIYAGGISGARKSVAWFAALEGFEIGQESQRTGTSGEK